MGVRALDACAPSTGMAMIGGGGRGGAMTAASGQALLNENCAYGWSLFLYALPWAGGGGGYTF